MGLDIIDVLLFTSSGSRNPLFNRALDEYSKLPSTSLALPHAPDKIQTGRTSTPPETKQTAYPKVGLGIGA